MGKSDTCAAPDCNHTSRGFCSFYYFPTHNPWRTLWIDALKRPSTKVDGVLVPWEPTAWDRLCSCHFTNPPNPKSRRLDAKWVVPDIFTDTDISQHHASLETDIDLPSASELSGSISEVSHLLANAAHMAAARKKEASPVSNKSQTASIISAQGDKTQTLAEILSSPPQHPIPAVTSAAMPSEAAHSKIVLTSNTHKTHVPSDERKRYRQTGMSLVQSQIQSKLLASIKNSIIELCHNALSYEQEINIEGLVGVTLDKRDVVLLNLQEHLEGSNTPVRTGSKVQEQYDPVADNHDDDPDWTPGTPSPYGASSSQSKTNLKSSRGKKRTHNQTSQHRNPIPDWKRARGETNEGCAFQNPDISTDLSHSTEAPVIKIEPVEPDDTGIVSELQKRLQSEIQAAQNKASIQSLSSKIVRLVHPQLESQVHATQEKHDKYDSADNPSSDQNRTKEDDSDSEQMEQDLSNAAKKRLRFSIEEKIEAVNTILKNDYTLEQASEILNIDVHKLGKWVNTYEDMVKYSTQGMVGASKGSRGRRPQFPELDEKICEYYMQVVATGGYCPDALLLRKARLIAKELHLDNFKGSVAYLRCWKKRHFQLQEQQEFEDLAQKVRQVFKHAYEEGRECTLESVESTAIELATKMNCDAFKNDVDWLRKWKMHYFCQESPDSAQLDGEDADSNGIGDDSVNNDGSVCMDHMEGVSKHEILSGVDEDEEGEDDFEDEEDDSRDADAGGSDGDKVEDEDEESEEYSDEDFGQHKDKEAGEYVDKGGFGDSADGTESDETADDSDYMD